MPANRVIYEEIKPYSKFGFGIEELWRYRELFYYYTLRYIKVRYKQTVLGFAWAVMQPMLMMVLFTFFFGKKLGVPSGNVPYPVFVLTGLLLWNIFSTGLTSASNSILDNAHIIKKIYFPRLIIPVSAVMVSLFDFLMAFMIYIVVLLIYQVPIDLLVFIPALLGAVIITTLTTFGLGSFLSALNIKFRDFKYVIPYSVQVLLFLSPVIYPASIVTDPIARILMALNPLTGAIGLLRYSMGGPPVEGLVMVVSCICAVLYLAFGVLYFKKSESYFADNA
ncbi:MAG: ABC transporter permease [Bacteroidota bacterium]|jgi:lipopolysaccharide transport system permease protein